MARARDPIVTIVAMAATDMATRLNDMTSDQRMGVFNFFRTLYCLHCGDKNPRCNCRRDE